MNWILMIFFFIETCISINGDLNEVLFAVRTDTIHLGYIRRVDVLSIACSGRWCLISSRSEDAGWQHTDRLESSSRRSSLPPTLRLDTTRRRRKRIMKLKRKGENEEEEKKTKLFLCLGCQRSWAKTKKNGVGSCAIRTHDSFETRDSSVRSQDPQFTDKVNS